MVIDTREQAWSETGALGGKLGFDKGRDIRGPLNLAVALTRGLNNRQQRVVVIGNGEFLSNTFLGNGGNLELGMSLANWLSHDDAYVSIPVQTARDRGLTLARRRPASPAYSDPAAARLRRERRGHLAPTAPALMPMARHPNRHPRPANRRRRACAGAGWSISHCWRLSPR